VFLVYFSPLLTTLLLHMLSA